MNILFVIPSLAIGGAEKLVVDILSIMKKEGYNVTLLTFKYDKSFLHDTLISNGVPIIDLNVKNIYSPKLIFSFKKYFKLYDIIHVHLFPTLYWVGLSRLLFGKTKTRLIFTEHSTHNKRRDKSYLRIIERFVYTKYDKIVCISEKVKANLLNWIKVSDSKKLMVINNGINIDIYESAKAYTKEDLRLPETAIVVLMVGRFTHSKDQKTVVNAVNILNNKNIHLLFAGDGELRPQVESLASDLNIADQVKFLGARTDIPRLIKTADICILSSHWEGFGLSAVEYMAGGKPVIASNVDGLRGVVDHAGLLFEHENAEDLSDKISYLIEDKGNYKIVQDKCIERAKLFDIKYTVAKYIELYKHLATKIIS